MTEKHSYKHMFDKQLQIIKDYGRLMYYVMYMKFTIMCFGRFYML